MNGTGTRGGLEGCGTWCAGVWRSGLQTLLVSGGCDGAMGLLPALLAVNPGLPR